MSQRLIILSFFVSHLVLGISGGLLGPTLDSLTRQFGIPLENGGIFITLHSTGVTISLIVIGWMYDSGRFAPRYLLCIGPATVAIGLLVLTITTVQWVAYVAAFIFGLGFGGILIGPTILIAVLFTGSVASRMNALSVFFGVGAILGPQVVNIAFSLDNYELAYLFTAAAALALIPAFLRVDTPARKLSGGDTPADSPQISVNWLTFVPFAALLFVYVGAEVGFGAWIATQLRLVSSLDEQTATIGVSFFWAGLTAGRMLATWLANHMRAINLLTLSASVLFVGTVLVLSFPEVRFFMFAAPFIVGLGCGPIFPTATAVVSDNYPRQFAAVSGIILGVGNGGAMLIPWLQGQVGNGDNGGVIVTFVASLLVLIIIAVIQRQVRSLERTTADYVATKTV